MAYGLGCLTLMLPFVASAVMCVMKWTVTPAMGWDTVCAPLAVLGVALVLVLVLAMTGLLIACVRG